MDKLEPQFVFKNDTFIIKDEVKDTLHTVFSHSLRNSIDHGIESPDERLHKGKKERGMIIIEALESEDRENLVISLSDDGRGLNLNRIKAQALAKGLIKPEDKLSDQEVANIVFAPGFSTSEEVSEISGRGIGMDAVRSAVTSMGGQIELRLLGASDSEGYIAFETKLELPMQYFETIKINQDEVVKIAS